MKGKRTIKCAKCGTEFGCQPQSKCWCNNYQLSQNQLKILKATYKDCLCENCITTFCEKDK
ncbi:MAG: hypothetical protein COA97_07065 [Flavobacteriales bacterium]|nr:MAG: hypothetical protein COA97_07065 [Flavobacteriales bacterium]